MHKFKLTPLLSLLVMALFSCTSSSLGDDPVPNPDDTIIKKLDVPDSFNFETSRQVNLEITDSDNGAYYFIYAKEDVVEYQEITSVGDEESSITKTSIS